MPDSAWTINVTDDTFETEVVERSLKSLVVVDFWAPWCAPCRTLGPVLEQLAHEFQGRFILAKIDVEQNQGVASAFGVQSIPLVVAVRGGQVVDGFQGALPETALREWLNKVLPSPAEELLTAALELEPTDPAAAEARLREALQFDTGLDAAKVALARLLLLRDDRSGARALIEDLARRGFLEPEAERIQAELNLQAAAADAPGVEAARQAALANPEDLNAHLELAEALAASHQSIEAMDLCLQVVQRDRSGAGARAKDVLLTIVSTLTDDDLASQYRRKLATLLY